LWHFRVGCKTKPPERPSPKKNMARGGPNGLGVPFSAALHLCVSAIK
jgi:hypothetical protein